ncbi:hypothetical protein F5Y14DRAFT_133861 [Nemania sp. NC0429]|nr:hypothetical protein F5Y14DRAFT_133861 [Nemania sp. NC0429]
MEAVSSPRGRSSSQVSQKTQALLPDYPSPLHIIKRTKTVEFRPNTRRETSNGSIDYGPDRPLNVKKKRQHCSPVKEATNDLTPKADFILQTQRKLKSRAPRRWFSRQRTSSSGTTCRRYDLRDCSTSSYESSIGQASSMDCPEEPSTLQPSGSQSSTQMDTSFSSMPTSAGCSDDHHLLVPHISVNAEVQSFNKAVSTVWVTIEISAQLSRPFMNDGLAPHPDNSLLLSNPLRVGSVSRFGYLYNLQVDVLPVPQTTVIEVVQCHRPRSLNLGSSMLVLAKVQINRPQPREFDRTPIQRPDELIADLESELRVPGIQYLQVRLRYHHSGFPALSSATPADGMADCRTSLETTVTAVLEQQALHLSTWQLPICPAESSLFGIVASYWGPLRANEIFSKRTRPLTHSTVTGGNPTLIDRHKAMANEGIFSPRPVLERSPFTPLPRRRPLFHQPSPEEGEDPARKIWTEMRRRTSQGRQNAAAPTMPERAAAAAYTYTGSLRLRSDVDRQRELLRDVALRNKRSIGADSLKSLVPSMESLDVGDKEAWCGSSASSASASAAAASHNNKENVAPDRRREGRWSIAGWW